MKPVTSIIIFKRLLDVSKAVIKLSKLIMLKKICKRSVLDRTVD